MIGESIKQAVHSVLSNKMRSFLTMLGMIIGVLSLVVLVSIVNGATSSVTDSISSIGTNYLTIQIQDDKGTPFTLEELEEIAEKGAVAATAPIAQGNATAKYDRTSSSISLRGTTGAYYEIQGLSLARGRFLKNADVNQKSQVAVINATAAEELFGNTNVVGEVFSIDGYKFTVIGVLEEQDSAIGNVSERLEAYIPFTVLSKISGSSREITSFYASSADEKSMDKVEAEMTAYLYKRLGDTDSFSVVNASSVMEAMTSVTDTMKLMLGGIAAIPLCFILVFVNAVLFNLNFYRSLFAASVGCRSCNGYGLSCTCLFQGNFSCVGNSCIFGVVAFPCQDLIGGIFRCNGCRELHLLTCG